MMTDGVTGNTSDFGSEESRFEPWSVNRKGNPAKAGFFILDKTEQGEKFIPRPREGRPDQPGTGPPCGVVLPAAGSWSKRPLITEYSSGSCSLNSMDRSKKYSTATAKNSSWLVAA